jgi:phosphoglycolate phosphatase
MKYKAVLFDLDGTLLDTLKDLADSVNKGLKTLGFPQHSMKTIKYFIGDGREVLAWKSLPENNRDEKTVNQLVDLINKEYYQHWADNTRPYPGVPELLGALEKRGIKMTILSNKPHEFTDLTVTRLLSGRKFEIVSGAVPSMPKKPDPAAALQIAEQLNICPARFLYVGDSDIDMKTAIAADMFPVGVTWGFRTAEELKAAGAKVLVHQPTELLELL